MELRPAPPGYRPYEIGFDLNQGFGAPQVAYRETPGSSVDIDYTHKRIMGPMGQFARVLIRFEPLAPGSGFSFENAVPASEWFNEFVPGVERGVRAVMSSGPRFGYPVIDCKATLLDGAAHDVDSSVLAFEIAARAAFREASEKVAMKLLEPIMKMEVVTPDDFVGTVIGDLNSRRGEILSQEIHGDAVVVRAFVPYANLWNYADGLQRATGGKARCLGELAGLAVVPLDDDRPPAVARRMTA